MHVNEKAKKEVKRILIRKEVRLILYPLSISIFLYGLWMFSFSSIICNFYVNHCLTSCINLSLLNLLKMLLYYMLWIVFRLSFRELLFWLGSISLAMWLMFNVSFLMCPPMIMVWI